MSEVCGEDQACLLCLALGSLLPSPHHFTKNCEFFLLLLVLFLLTVSLCASIHHDWALLCSTLSLLWFGFQDMSLFSFPSSGGIVGHNGEGSLRLSQ